jgi:hypothetical protein
VVEALLVGVYRADNAAHVSRLIRPALQHGWPTAWWALDRITPDLRDVTVGEGKGEKLPLLNAVLQRAGISARWTVVSDDDVRFRRSDVVGLVGFCQRAALDLAQPARARGTQRSHDITTAIPLVRARRTTFVESGPLFVVGPGWRDRLLPFPVERGMGWGLELDWFDFAERGCALGVVDACLIEHMGSVGEDYDTTEIRGRLEAELAERGAESWAPFQRTVAAWRPWQRRPPWRRGAPQGA